MDNSVLIRGLAEALRKRHNDGNQEAKDILIDFLGSISTRILCYFKCCNALWAYEKNNPAIELGK